jgi:hypothetical protein
MVTEQLWPPSFGKCQTPVQGRFLGPQSMGQWVDMGTFSRNHLTLTMGGPALFGKPLTQGIDRS